MSPIFVIPSTLAEQNSEEDDDNTSFRNHYSTYFDIRNCDAVIHKAQNCEQDDEGGMKGKGGVGEAKKAPPNWEITPLRLPAFGKFDHNNSTNIFLLEHSLNFMLIKNIYRTRQAFVNPILLGGGQICPRTFFWKNYSAELYECHIFWLLEIFSINLDLNNFQKKKTG